MRHVNFNPRNVDEDPEIPAAEKRLLKAWLDEAERTAREAIEHYERTGERPKEKDTLWKRHKNWLLKYKFNNKCAYCEQSLVDADQHAEHWRPKRGVVYNLEEEETDDLHPGYFWLAYNWQNLLPSCSHCNAYNGKRNAFPTRGGHFFLVPLSPEQVGNLKGEAIESLSEPNHFYLSPEDLDDLEGPELLHPYFDDPDEHLGFEARGLIFYKTPKGERSIEVYNLDRERLVTDRDREQWAALMSFRFAFDHAIREEKKSYSEAREAAWAYVHDYVSGVKPFSRAVLVALVGGEGCAG